MFGSVCDFRNNILYDRKKDFALLLSSKEKYKYEVWSFDEKDCISYHMNYNQTMFPAIPMKRIIRKYDVVYLGLDKGRFNYISDLDKRLQEIGINTFLKFFKLNGTKEEKNKYELNKYMEYPIFLQHELQGKAILEVVQKNQSSMTWRPLEAMYYGRKLITNYVAVKELSFYNKNNIFVLGEDDLNSIKEFLNSPFEKVSNEIIEEYIFYKWVQRFFN